MVTDGASPAAALKELLNNNSYIAVSFNVDYHKDAQNINRGYTPIGGSERGRLVGEGILGCRLVANREL